MDRINKEFIKDVQEKVTFRLMRYKDIDDVLKIERASFPIPWTWEAFHNELVCNKYAKYLLMELEDKVIGYCGVWVIIDEAHITNIAVLPEYRGQKLGETLLKAVIELVTSLGAKSLTLEVRVSNEIAQNLYKKLGFQYGGVRKNYYTDNNEDAIVMWVNL